MVSVEGKVVLISGGAGGMGAHHARRLVAAGARVVIGDVATDTGEVLAGELGQAARFTRLDVRADEDWRTAVETAESGFGRLDVLVNNAGVFKPGGAIDTSDADWDLVIGINLTGAYRGIRAAAPAIARAGGGSIINISSTAGLKGFTNGIAYGAAKWGLRGVTKHAAIDLAPLGIRVNSIHPGNIKTPMIDGLYPDFSHVLQNRAGEPEEISSLVLFLSGDESSFSTGSEFIADGGETAGLPARPLAGGETSS